ncbi:MAG: nucleoside hydrolase [Euzebyaceae bacterium]|nr:nucleoside hydrolase [Euzebyaceae bacterium]
MTLPLLMDVDTGIDDALALLLAVRSPELRLVGAGAVAGNISVDLAARNTLRVLEVVGATDVLVAVGAAAPLLEERADAAWVHGSDGLGDSGQPHPAGKLSEESAVEQLLRLSHEHAGELVVVAVGPLTNIAMALRTDSTVVGRLARIVVMGGSARAGGNLAAWGEANIAHDPEAAAIVFEADVARTMIGLDVTMRSTLGEPDVQRLATSGDPAGTFAAQILPHYLAVYERWTGERRCPVHDALAVAVAAQPDLVAASELPVRVECAGRHTRGMTVVDLRGLLGGGALTVDGPRSAVALDVDAERFLDLLLERLTGGGHDGEPEDGTGAGSGGAAEEAPGGASGSVA